MAGPHQPFGLPDSDLPHQKYMYVCMYASSETQGQSVGSGERARRKFQVRAKEPLGTDSHRAISQNSS